MREDRTGLMTLVNFNDFLRRSISGVSSTRRWASDRISNNRWFELQLHEGRHSDPVVRPALRVKVAGRKAEVRSRSVSLKVVEFLVFSLLHVSTFRFSNSFVELDRFRFTWRSRFRTRRTKRAIEELRIRTEFVHFF